jgi:oligopeptidase A
MSLDHILEGTIAGERELSTVTTSICNKAHLRTYLESNSRHLGAATPWPGAEADAAERRRVLAWAESAVCQTPSQDLVRERLVQRLQDFEVALGSESAQQERDVLATIGDTLGRVAADRARLLMRIGVPVDSAPEVLFSRTIAGLPGAASRAKLARAWDGQLNRHADELLDALDALIELRWTRALENGYASPLEQTLVGSDLSESDVDTLLSEYINEAVAVHERLQADVRSTTRCTDDPMNHFAFYLRGLRAGLRLPVFPLEACLDTAATVIQSAFGCTVIRGGGQPATLSVGRSGRPMGIIQVDILDDLFAAVGPPTGIWTGEGTVQPVGRVLARCRRGDDGAQVLNFESAQSLFHEFGHAMTHLLLVDRRPDPGGLDHLPVERLEDLSAWFEKWVYHTEFTANARSDGDVAGGLALCRRVKALEFIGSQVRRVVVAAVDTEVHRRRDGVRAAFRRLDQSWGAGRFCQPADLVHHFTSQVFRTHPGMAGSTYLRSYAWSAEQFELRISLGLGNPYADRIDGALEPCFNPSMPSDPVDVLAIQRFYQRILADSDLQGGHPSDSPTG